jgi:hypothetical protein
MSALKPGMRLRSAVCATEVMVIQAPEGDVAILCGGAPMLGFGEPSAPAAAPAEGAPGAQIGKRYVSAAGDLELLCTRAGKGPLAVGAEVLAVKGAKPLPSSD